MSDSNDPKLAKADAKAAKAKAKALRPWYKKKRVIIPAIFVILFAAGRAIGGNSSSEDTSAGSDSSSSAKLGDTVNSGDFSFVANSIQCGIASVGSDLLGAKAQGQYCEVSVSVTNTGKESKTLFADDQKLYDTAGAEYSPDTTAAIYVDNGALWSDINPGNTLQGVIVYDVPSTFQASYIKFKGGSFSFGKKVSLGN